MGETRSRGVLKGKIAIVRVIMIATLMLLAASAATIVRAEGAARIWTDKADYSPEETVMIFGAGFLPESPIAVEVTRPDLTVDGWAVVSDADGNFTTTYPLDGVTGTYTVTATDGTNTATTTFSDKTETVTITATVGGSVGYAYGSTTGTVDPGTAVSLEIPRGKHVTFSATSQPGYSFTGWSGDLSGTTTPQTIEVRDDLSVTATFTAAKYLLTVTASPAGAIGGSFRATYYKDGSLHSSELHTTDWTEWVDVGSDVTLSDAQAEIIVGSTKYVFDSYDPSASIDDIAAASTITLKYATYYWVTVAANVPVTLPAKEWVLSGQAATGVFPTSIVSGDTQYVLVSDDGPLTITAPTLITATYNTYCWVTYVANVPVALPADEWVLSGQAATGVFPTPVVSGDTKHVFVSDGRPLTITSPTTITATYDTYYKVTFTQTGLDSSATGEVVVEAAGSDKTLPFKTDWIKSGDGLSYSYGILVASSDVGQQFWLLSVSGSASPITVTSAETIAGNYVKLPLITVTSISLCHIAFVVGVTRFGDIEDSTNRSSAPKHPRRIR